MKKNLDKKQNFHQFFHRDKMYFPVSSNMTSECDRGSECVEGEEGDMRVNEGIPPASLDA